MSFSKIISLFKYTIQCFLNFIHVIIQILKWQPTPVLLPGKSHGRRSLIDYSPWGCEESDTTERLHSLTSLTAI